MLVRTLLRCLTLSICILTACSGGSGSSDNSPSGDGQGLATAPASVVGPIFEAWVSNMSTFGRVHCETLKDSGKSDDERLGATYYDAIWIYQQIRDFTGDSYWDSCIAAARSIYRDAFVLDSGGQVPGYWNFSHGIRRDALSNDSSTSRSAIDALVNKAAFSNVQSPLEWTLDDELSREVAYTVMTYLNARTLGQFYPEERMLAMVEQAFGHISQWVNGDADYVRPFMVGLTAQALIEYHAAYGDPAVVPALQEALDYIWERTWNGSSGSFQYTDREHSSGGTELAPDLNLLIAPAFMWLHLQTGQQKYFDQAEAIFAGGVQGAWLGGAKQFNQNYRWSFTYLQWRELAISR